MIRADIIAVFRRELDELHIHYHIGSPRKGAIVLSFGMKIESRIPGIFALFEFRQSSFRIFGVFLEQLPRGNEAEMLRLVAMANRKMSLGCFEYEMESGGIRFRHFVDCRGFSALPDAGELLLLPFEAFQRFCDAFATVAEGSADAATAFAEACRNGEDGDAPGPDGTDGESKAVFAAVRRYVVRQHGRHTESEIPGGYAIHCPSIRFRRWRRKLSLTLEVLGTHLFSRASFSVRTPPERMDEMAKFVALANYNQVLGHFDLDVETGEVRYSHDLECSGFAKVPSMPLKRHLPIPLLMIGQYGEAIAAVANGKADAETALGKVGQEARPLVPPKGSRRPARAKVTEGKASREGNRDVLHVRP